jgi:hypothetical protein
MFSMIHLALNTLYLYIFQNQIDSYWLQLSGKTHVHLYFYVLNDTIPWPALGGRMADSRRPF